MKLKFIPVLFFLVFTSIGWAAKVTITNVGVTFSPNTVTINTGDTVIFTLQDVHNVVEVTKATWDANDNTPKAGGFSIPFGGGQHKFVDAGTYYFVCSPHASLGMKGTITVNLGTSVPEETVQGTEVIIFPNPVQDHMDVSYALVAPSDVTVNVVSMDGDKIVSYTREQIAGGRHDKTYYLPVDIKPGIYIVQLSINGIKTTRKIIVVK